GGQLARPQRLDDGDPGRVGQGLEDLGLELPERVGGHQIQYIRNIEYTKASAGRPSLQRVALRQTSSAPATAASEQRFSLSLLLRFRDLVSQLRGRYEFGRAAAIRSARVSRF